MAVSMGKGWKPKFLLQVLSEEEKEETIANVAWRMINIYRQLHIFTKEDIDRYNKSILDIDMELQMLISEYPGGAEVSRYIAYLKGQDEIEQKSTLTAEEIADEKAKARILAEALAQKDAQSGEKIVTVQLDTSGVVASEDGKAAKVNSLSGGVVASGANDAFANAFPPVPTMSSSSFNIENASFGDEAMEKMVELIVKAQSEASEKHTNILADAISKAVLSGQETSANAIAEVLSKIPLGQSLPEAPIDVSYSTVPAVQPSLPEQTESNEYNNFTSFISTFSEKIASSLSSAIITSQEASTKTLAKALSSISIDNSGASDGIADAIVQGMKGVNFGSVKMEVDHPLQMEISSPVKMEGSTNLDISGATINASGGGMSEDMMNSFVQAFSSAQLEVSQVQSSHLAEAFSKSFIDAQTQASQIQADNIALALSKSLTEAQTQASQIQADNIALALSKSLTEAQTQASQVQADNLAFALSKSFTEAQTQASQVQADNLALAFSKSFTEAQIQVSQTQSDNLVDAFAKAVTMSQSEVSASLQEVVSEIMNSQNNNSNNNAVSAQEISGIISDAIDKIKSSDIFSSSQSLAQNNEVDVAMEMATVMEKMMSSFAESQLQISQTQADNIEKILETTVANISLLNDKMQEDAIEENIKDEKENIYSDTYKEMWIGDEDFMMAEDEDSNSDIFELDNEVDTSEVSLTEALSLDPYNVLLKQNKVFKEHKILYDSEVGLHIAYSGMKAKESKGESNTNE